jgi:hypothetical protein
MTVASEGNQYLVLPTCSIVCYVGVHSTGVCAYALNSPCELLQELIGSAFLVQSRHCCADTLLICLLLVHVHNAARLKAHAG